MADNWLMAWDQSLLDLVREDGSEEKSPWHALSTRWNEPNKPQLWEIEMAVYVLTISKPFTFNYPTQPSHIFYIGEGFAHARFKEHIDRKMLPWLESLTQARFDFHVLPCDCKKRAQASETCLLKEFEAKFGQKPLLNIQNGKEVDCQPHPDWHRPLDLRSHKQREWAIWPIGKLERPN